MKRTVVLLAASALALACAPKPAETLRAPVSKEIAKSQSSPDGYDVVILGGRVMDPETSFDRVANVGITDGKIVAITDVPLSGKESIDASGYVVSAGFIDTHHHGVGSLFGMKLSLRDGVTTPMDLELGAANVGEWYAERDGKWPVNYGTSVSHEFHRMRVLDKMTLVGPKDAGDFAALRNASYEGDDTPDWAVTRSSLDQLNDILKGLDAELKDGALGVASTTAYMGKGVTTFELFNVQKVAANYGRTYSSHVRLLGNSKPPTEGTLGALEEMANGVSLRQPLIFSHNNNQGWWEVEEHAQLLREQGYNVWSEYYPYTCGSSTIGSEFIKPDAIGKLGLSYDDMIDPKTGKVMGRERYEEVAAEDPAYIIVLCIPAREEWLPLWLSVPHMTVAGDQMPPTDVDGTALLDWDEPYAKYNGHPRTAGTHARVLRLARENDVPLMQTIAQQSFWAAKHLGDAGVDAMKLRGRMQEGMVADITIFDPENVTDNATYKIGENGLPSTGIPFVLVNGVIVVDGSQVKSGLSPGQPIRYAAEDNGRFELLEKKKYLKELLAPDMPHLDDEALGPHAPSSE